MNILLEERKALVTLSIFHMLVIVSSNYLVQFPFDINLGFVVITTTPGSFTFPLIFLATDLTVRIFTAALARKIIFIVMIPALIVSYVISVVFYQGGFIGFSNLGIFDMDIFRIALASFTAYAVGQLMDILVFNRFRKMPQWWIAPSAASIAGSAVDTFLFFFVAFFRADNLYMASNWHHIGFIDYLTKLVISFIFMLPMYGIILNWILKRIQKSKK